MTLDEMRAHFQTPWKFVPYPTNEFNGDLQDAYGRLIVTHVPAAIGHLLAAAPTQSARIAALEAECARLRKLLQDYGYHAPECRHDQGPYYNHNVGPCTCGWDTAQQSLAAPTEGSGT